MAGWLDPVGPEPRRVYWIRRAMVAAAVLLVLGVIVGIVATLTRPAPAARTTPTSPATTAQAPGAAGSTQRTVSPSPTPTAAPSSAAATTPQPTGPVACDPAKLELSVTGEKSVKSGDEAVLKVSITNKSDVACIIDVNQKSYQLTVSSGEDRIWSTADCGDWLAAPAKGVVESGKGQAWDIRWNTRRSQAECKVTGDYLKPGTYVARATYTGAPRASLVIILRG